MPIITKSELTCPECGHAQDVDMPTDACLFFYQCQSCEKVMKPRHGDCCVFCSYSPVPCPPKQAEARSGAVSVPPRSRDEQCR